MNPNVEGMDVVDRKVDSQGVLKSHRLMITDWAMPGWVARVSTAEPQQGYIIKCRITYTELLNSFTPVLLGHTVLPRI
jgi:hypothetical protein